MLGRVVYVNAPSYNWQSSDVLGRKVVCLYAFLTFMTHWFSDVLRHYALGVPQFEINSFDLDTAVVSSPLLQESSLILISWTDVVHLETIVAFKWHLHCKSSSIDKSRTTCVFPLTVPWHLSFPFLLMKLKKENEKHLGHFIGHNAVFSYVHKERHEVRHGLSRAANVSAGAEVLQLRHLAPRWVYNCHSGHCALRP